MRDDKNTMIYSGFIKPGSVLLSHALRRSTIAAGDFRFPVRDGWSVGFPAMATRPNKTRITVKEKLTTDC